MIWIAFAVLLAGLSIAGAIEGAGTRIAQAVRETRALPSAERSREKKQIGEGS
jgi:hypothetical protein